jgi:hypothetical protein
MKNIISMEPLLTFPTFPTSSRSLGTSWDPIGSELFWELGIFLGASTSKKWELGNECPKRRALI